MKRKQKNQKNKDNSFWQGFVKGKKFITSKVLKFIDEESEFLPDIHIDYLLDRLVKFIKKI